MRLRERDVLKACLDWLNTVPFTHCWRRNTGAMKAVYKGRDRMIRFAQAGQSDIWGIGPNGIHIEIEIKSFGKIPNEAQDLWLMDCIAFRAVAFYCDSLDDCASKLSERYKARGFEWRDTWLPR